MKIIVRGRFGKDIHRVRDQALRKALDTKIEQIKAAKGTDQITGLKLLTGYTNHYRIIIRAGTKSYRIGAIIRRNTIWLVRFLPRKRVYRKFP